MTIDAHCHLERETYGDELDDVIARAFDAGLSHLIAVGATRGILGAREAVTLAERLDRVYATVAIHPHDAHAATPSAIEEVEALLSHAKVVALGEIGLDYHYDFAPRAEQRALFERMLQIGQHHRVPVMLHVREAHDDALTLLDRVGLSERGGVVHCFTEGPDIARAYLERGMYLSVPGVVTFRGQSAEPLREAVRQMPLERLLIETDSPYLAPVPHRGRRNEPAYIVATREAIAQLRGLSAEDIGRITSRNAMALFDLDSEIEAALAYPIRDSLYLNLTNRCTLGCRFCPKVERRDWWVRGHWLRLRTEPETERLLQAIEVEVARRPEIREVVFVGLGEPTLRLETLLEVARSLRDRHGTRFRLRVDTDGLGSLVHGRDITRDLARDIDLVSVSLNAPDAATYARLCPSRYGEEAYGAVKSFIAAARQAGIAVTATVVGLPELDVAACRKIAEQELGVAFRVRVYQEYG